MSGPARTRLLKPGFFTNEGLAELRPPDSVTSTPAASFAARLCFAGLWVVADRSGRLEDRPKRLKAEIFPYDDVDVDALLTELADHGYIARYHGSDGEPYIAIATFPKHQHPHPRETASTIPAPSLGKRANNRPGPAQGNAKDRPGRDQGHAKGAPSPSCTNSNSDPNSNSVRTSNSDPKTNTQRARSVQASAVDRVLADYKKKHQRQKIRGRFR